MDRPPPAPHALSTAGLEAGDAQRLLLHGYPGVVLLLSRQGRVLETNPAGAQRLGPGGEDLLLAPLPKEGAEAVSREAALRPGALHDWAFRHPDGSTQTLRLAIGRLQGPQGEDVGLVAVEPWPRSEEDVPLPLHHHDTLTGLPTRAVLMDRAEMALQRAARQKSVVAMLLVEVSGFQALCREHGEAVGDDVLRATASRLHFELRKTDTAVRLDDGQFAVMLVDLHQADEALQVAAKIHQVLSSPVTSGSARLPLAVRIGAAWSPVHGDQLLPLINAAEAALGEVDAAQGGVAGARAGS